MNAVVIEDEKLAASHLCSLLNDLGNIRILTVLDSIESSVEWFKTNSKPDLVFMDIHLADGSAFKIFEFTDITSPIIFTTAYDE